MNVSRNVAHELCEFEIYIMATRSVVVVKLACHSLIQSHGEEFGKIKLILFNQFK